MRAINGRKVCSKCQTEKLVTEFYTDRSNPDKLQSRCILCEADTRSISRQRNKLKNANINFEGTKLCPKCNQEKPKIEFSANRNRPDGVCGYCRVCKAVKRAADYRKNPQKYIDYTYDYQIERRKIDPLYKFVCDMRTLIGGSFRRCGFRKNTKTAQILGKSPKEFQLYVESKFLPGMTFENHGFGVGKWHIDHVVPLDTAKTFDDVVRLCHYTNLQPLWHEDNLSKGAKCPS